LSHVSKVILDESSIHGETKPIVIYENNNVEQQPSQPQAAVAVEQSSSI
jgi:hypothetical protein